MEPTAGRRGSQEALLGHSSAPRPSSTVNGSITIPGKVDGQPQPPI